MSIATRLAALKRHLTRWEEEHAPTEPWTVLLVTCATCDGGTTVHLGYLGSRPSEDLTLNEYRQGHGTRYHHLESWIIAGDTEPDPDRLCVHWLCRKENP